MAAMNDDDMEVDVEGVLVALKKLDIAAREQPKTIFMYADGVYNQRESAMANYIKHAGIEDKAVVFFSTLRQRDWFERCAERIGLNIERIVFYTPELSRGLDLRKDAVLVVAHPTKDLPKIDELLLAIQVYAHCPEHWYELHAVFPKPYAVRYKTPEIEPFQVNYVETIRRETEKQKKTREKYKQTYNSLFNSILESA